jgi:putative hydrolase of the HAD superfamily
MSDLWPIHTLVFDLDDTLYPESEYVLSGFAAAGDWLSEHLAVQGFEHRARRLFSAGVRGRIFDEALAQLGMNATPELIAGLVNAYRTHTPTLHLYPDAKHILEWSHANGLKLAVITDGYAGVQRAKIHALALESRLCACLVTDELGGRLFWKPHREAFQRVMVACPGPAAGYVYVADNPKKDFVAPQALGWKSVRIRRKGCEHSLIEADPGMDADREIATLIDLQQFIIAAP